MRRVSAQEVGVPAVLAQFDHHVVEDVSRLVVVVRVERLYPACVNKNKKNKSPPRVSSATVTPSESQSLTHQGRCVNVESGRAPEVAPTTRRPCK